MSRPRTLAAPPARRVVGRLLLLVALVLIVAATVLSAVAYGQLRGLQRESEQVRAHLIAFSLTQKLGNALEIGIPLTQLVGVPELFGRSLAQHAELQSLVLQTPDGQVLWRVERDTAQAAGSADPAEITELAVQVRGQTRARLQLRLQSDALQGFMGRALTELAPAVLLLALLGGGAAFLSWGLGPQLRNHASRIAVRHLAQGRYDFLTVLPYRRSFDLRVQELSHRVRQVHETLVRVRRQLASLRLTEPQYSRREQLDQLLVYAQGDDVFSDAHPTRLRLVAVRLQAVWLALLMGLSGASQLMLTLGANGSSAALGGRPGLLVGMALVVLLSGAALAAWRLPLQIGRPVQGLRLAMAVLVGQALLSMLGGSSAWGVAGSALLAGGAFGLVTVVCTQVGLTGNAVRPGGRFKQLALSGPVSGLAALWLCLLWLGPLMASLSDTSFGLPLARGLLLLPVVCAWILLYRWSQGSSPWSEPAVSAPTAAYGPIARSARPVGLAKGLAWGITLSVVWTGTALDRQALLCWSAIGGGWLIGWVLARRWPRSWALAICVVAVLAAAALVGHLPAWTGLTPIAAALLGCSLGLSQRSARLAQQTELFKLFLLSGLLLGACAGAALVAGLATPWAMVAASALLLWSLPLHKGANHAA